MHICRLVLPRSHYFTVAWAYVFRGGKRRIKNLKISVKTPFTPTYYFPPNSKISKSFLLTIFKFRLGFLKFQNLKLH